MSASRTKALHALAEPIVAQFDADLEKVVIRRAGKRQLVRVVVDASEGLTLDLVASISRAVSQALDDASVLGSGPYVLEVTSPGVDRPLSLPRHWQRAVGRLVRVTDRAGNTYEGRLTDVHTDDVVLEAGGVEETIALADVSRAVVQVEFSRVEEAQIDDADSGDDSEPDDSDLGDSDLGDSDLGDSDLGDSEPDDDDEPGVTDSRSESAVPAEQED